VSVAVIGIGQRLRGDDAAGLEAVRLWETLHSETSCRSDVRVACVEGSGLEMIELLRDVDGAVLVDAVTSCAAPGTVKIVAPEVVSSQPGDSAAAHGWGIKDVLRLAQLVLPEMTARKIRLLGIEAEQFRQGHGLSDAVQDGLPALSEVIEQQVQSLLRS